MNETHKTRVGVWLHERARDVIKAEGWDAHAESVLIPHWQRFADFVIGRGETPGSVTDIGEDTLVEFSRHCDVDGAVRFEEASLALGVVRLILLRSGYDREALAALSAPRRAKRAKKKRKAPVTTKTS
ncbi:hypothetical protein [Paraburkholderia terrae]|uniref:hypothetical protein n=1 Tax=Paraburkholderia terrae TaxID=311230 RepID=UPI0012E07974|nr:hypothetical protein [Paraburkholderia terrae]